MNFYCIHLARLLLHFFVFFSSSSTCTPSAHIQLTNICIALHRIALHCILFTYTLSGVLFSCCASIVISLLLLLLHASLLHLICMIGHLLVLYLSLILYPSISYAYSVCVVMFAALPFRSLVRSFIL